MKASSMIIAVDCHNRFLLFFSKILRIFYCNPSTLYYSYDGTGCAPLPSNDFAFCAAEFSEALWRQSSRLSMNLSL